MVVFTNIFNPDYQLYQSINHFLSSVSQTSSSIDSARTCVSYVIDKEQTDFVLCSQNTTPNDLNITSNYDIGSCETQRKQNYRIPTTSTKIDHVRRISAMPFCSFSLHTTVKLPPVSKKYMCFQIDIESAQASKF